MRFRTRPSILVLATVALLGLPANVVSGQAPSTTALPEHLTTDTPKSTVGGTTFVAPAGWNFSVRGIATILEPPEGDSHIALVDVRAPSADSKKPSARSTRTTTSSAKRSPHAPTKTAATRSTSSELGRRPQGRLPLCGRSSVPRLIACAGAALMHKLRASPGRRGNLCISDTSRSRGR